MNERILCVDDDVNVLQAYQRALRKQFHIDIALGGKEAIEAVTKQGPYAVVVADMKMPQMNGVELLKMVKQHAKDTVRMMLTGNADQDTALDAVNEGHIFRFMTKPCPPEAFAEALDAGLEQYRLIRTERELLSKTFTACVKVLTDVLSAVNPQAFGRASRLRQLVRGICQQLEVAEWQIEVAAMLSQIGCVGIPEKILAKAYAGKDLTPAEQRIYDDYPLTGQQLIGNIPRLEEVAQIVAYQLQHFNGQGVPGDGKCAGEIPLGSRILKIAIDFDTLMSGEFTHETAAAEMNDRSGLYDPSVLAALIRLLAIREVQVVRRVRLSELADGFTLAEDIKTHNGTLVCASGQEVTRAVRYRLKNFSANIGLHSSVRVFVPKDMAHLFQEDDVRPIVKCRR